MKPRFDTAQIAADYLAGATLRTLAQRYAYSHTQIATILEAASVPRRHSWGRVKTCPTCWRSFHARRDQIHCSMRCRRSTNGSGWRCQNEHV